MLQNQMERDQKLEASTSRAAMAAIALTNRSQLGVDLDLFFLSLC
jgi:hypothetical protein